MVRLKGHNKAEEDDNPVDCVSLLSACHLVWPAKVDETDALNALSGDIGLTAWLERRKTRGIRGSFWKWNCVKVRDIKDIEGVALSKKTFKDLSWKSKIYQLMK